MNSYLGPGVEEDAQAQDAAIDDDELHEGRQRHHPSPRSIRLFGWKPWEIETRSYYKTTSLIEFRHQIHSGDLLAFLFLNGILWHSLMFLMLSFSNSARKSRL